MTKKWLNELKGMKCYEGYYITPEGKIFSTKYSTDRELKFNDVKEYKTIRLSNGKGENRTFYVHRLVALSFLPNPSHAIKIRHKNRNTHDNHVTNLEWIVKKKIIRKYDPVKGKERYEKRKSQYIDPSCLIVNKDMSDRIRLIHYATIKKGLSTPVEDYDFFYKILNESLDEYVNRYGLKRIMFQLENHSN
jgi:hypothetical protein